MKGVPKDFPKPEDFVTTGGDFLPLLYTKACFNTLNGMEKATILRVLNQEFMPNKDQHQ